MKEMLLDKIKSKLALIFIIVVIFTKEYWLLGFLFLVWVVLDLKNKQTYLMEIIQRRENPFLYWSIIFMWFIFSITSFMSLTYY